MGTAIYLSLPQAETQNNIPTHLDGLVGGKFYGRSPLIRRTTNAHAYGDRVVLVEQGGGELGNCKSTVCN